MQAQALALAKDLGGTRWDCWIGLPDRRERVQPSDLCSLTSTSFFFALRNFFQQTYR